jgi:MSHA pilin protein MshD
MRVGYITVYNRSVKLLIATLGRARRLAPQDSGGMTLIEYMVALLVWGIVLAGLMPAVWRAVRDTETLEETVRVRMLAEEIEEEIAASPRADIRSFDEDAASPAPGAAPARRADFTDIAQYNGLVEAPPRDILGDSLPGTAHLTRTVSIDSVDPVTLATVEDERGRLLRITVAVLRDGETILARSFFRSAL